MWAQLHWQTGGNVQGYGAVQRLDAHLQNCEIICRIDLCVMLRNDLRYYHGRVQKCEIIFELLLNIF